MTRGKNVSVSEQGPYMHVMQCSTTLPYPLGHRVFFWDYDYCMYMGVCVSRMRAMRQGSVGVVVCVVVLWRCLESSMSDA